MLISMGILMLAGLAGAALAQKARLPRILGMILAGIAVGPVGLNLLGADLLALSPDLRRLALLILLLHAGLAVDLRGAAAVARPILLIATLPPLAEVLAALLLAPPLLGLDASGALVLGCVLAAISPAVIVPAMLRLMQQGRGTAHRVPHILATAVSLDNVFVLALAAAAFRVAQDGAGAGPFLRIPLALLSGLALGLATGWALARGQRTLLRRGAAPRPTLVVLTLLALALLLQGLEGLAPAQWPFSGLLAVLGMAACYRWCSPVPAAEELAAALGHLWLWAEVVLFVLVGAGVDPRATLAVGGAGLLLLLAAYLARSAATWLSLLGTPLTTRERAFCLLACLPKATVQAAIGSVPLALGLPCGGVACALAVLSMLVTAPLGVIAIERSWRRLLPQDDPA
ncbi:MAG: cation:proton antiporter [Anaerolineae bacterium]|jgi:NhaP-type Na+/H+ or K+/H+ antiporter|nr:sodium:proton antiporter [Chloroflexota bacterium]